MPGVDLRKQPLDELTRLVLGRTMSLDDVFAALEDVELPAAPARREGLAAPAETRPPTTWLGSIGYERHRSNADFAAVLAGAGVERLVDVRQLPISRRRGYAKTALSAALAADGIEYVHMRALGNPKPLRDLYKSGRVDEGRDGYERYLLGEQRAALDDLAGLMREKRCALMCVEHDPAVCHRAVIIHALRTELNLDLQIANLG